MNFFTVRCEIRRRVNYKEGAGFMVSDAMLHAYAENRQRADELIETFRAYDNVLSLKVLTVADCGPINNPIFSEREGISLAYDSFTDKTGLLFENEYRELKSFIESLECFKDAKGFAGPVQDLPIEADARNECLAIIVPISFYHIDCGRELPGKIMEEVKSWAQARGLEGIGCVVSADCPLLLIGLRLPKPAAS